MGAYALTSSSPRNAFGGNGGLPYHYPMSVTVERYSVDLVFRAMTVNPLPIPDLLVLEPEVHGDGRGHFFEAWNDRVFRAEVGADTLFVQDNQSLSRAGVIRGLHYQLPHPQGKLVRVVVGRAFTVAVDIRRSSDTFGRWHAVELSADNRKQLWVPVGFAHGYCTLEPDTEVIYKATALYDPASERGIQFDDPALAIDWPFSRSTAQLSRKDLEYRPLCEQPVHFQYKTSIFK